MSESADSPLQALAGMRLSRRALLFGIGSAALLGATVGLAPARVGATDANAKPVPAQFWLVARALTGVTQLDQALGQRIYSGLQALDAALDERLSRLAPLLIHDGPATALSELAAHDAALGNTAEALLSAWYLGVIGKGRQAHVVAYEHALMYAPLADVCVLPSFARGEPHYWARPAFTTGASA